MELSKCPFCGCEAAVYNTGDYWPKIFYRVVCKKACCVQGPFYETEEKAIEAWNRRAR